MQRLAVLIHLIVGCFERSLVNLSLFDRVSVRAFHRALENISGPLSNVRRCSRKIDVDSIARRVALFIRLSICILELSGREVWRFVRMRITRPRDSDSAWIVTSFRTSSLCIWPPAPISPCQTRYGVPLSPKIFRDNVTSFIGLDARIRAAFVTICWTFDAGLSRPHWSRIANQQIM